MLRRYDPSSLSSLVLLALAVTASTIFSVVDVRGFSFNDHGRIGIVHNRSPKSSLRSSSSSSIPNSNVISTTSDDIEFITYDGKIPSVDWEIDCYSRPVVTAGGKKLWEVLITDSTGSFRFCKTIPSNKVNSKELRQTVEELMEDPNIDTKPSVIRFFRGAMFNMINIALNELDVVGRPSRCTYSIAQWLEERHRDVYPNMEG